MEEKEQFLKELEKEHAEMVRLLNDSTVALKNEEIKDAAAIIKTLNQLKDVLAVHLNSEDSIFYPDMKKRAVELKQDALLPAIDVFIEDMKKISKNVFDFFSKYKTEDAVMADTKGFIKDIIALKDALIKRINTEEKTLYYIYRAYYNI